MNRANKLTTRLLVWTQILSLLALTTYAPASLASSKSDLDYSDLTQLANLETVIYGSPHKNLPNDKRVDSLEKILFGKSHSGPLHSRIYAIASTLTGSPNNSLSPPVAPSLDHDGENSLKGSAPELSQDNNADLQDGQEARQDRIHSQLQQAMQLYGSGQIDKAESEFKNVLSLDKDNVDANFNLGAIAESRSDWAEALHYYQSAARGNPNDDEIRNAMQSMQSKLASSNEKASYSGSKLSGKQLSSLKAKVNQAANDYAQGHYDSAINNLKAVISQAPDQADVYFALGQAYKAKNDKVDAAQAFTKAAGLAPDNKQYSDALAEVEPSQSQADASPRAADTFSSDSSSSTKHHGKDKLANNNTSSNDSDWTEDKPGEITPFSDQGNQELGWQPAGAIPGSQVTYYNPAFGSAYMPGYAYSNYIPYSMTNMLGGVAMGSLAGAAIGSMMSPYGYRMRGAMTGGMIGGMMGGRMMGGFRHR